MTEPAAAAALTPTEIFAMKPDEAGAKLTEMKAAYQGGPTPADALKQRYAAPKFVQQIAFGSVEARQEFDRLVTAAAVADPVKAAMAGVLPEVPSSELLQMERTAGMLRDIGIRDAVVEEFLSGRQAPPAEYQAVRQWRADKLADKEWTARLLAGDLQARRELALANIVIVNGVREDAA